ncbi:hypothetical protein CBR_g618 [Chara braunii]|uniref:Cystinosin homolog n=1 Tax=Chara braunii TaxID=69332 RepID=A0A388KC01_CHABU|nr:hypothetical protein CBR_g618 [Chara braunii]|eukprot:GBG67483.1 hypothetical protein CBR_g618 [Chara braunii]
MQEGGVMDPSPSDLLVVDAQWQSPLLYFLYNNLGWLAFTVWSISFYPQVLLNYRRKSVEGLNFDFVIFNLTKHSTYCIFNIALFFSPVVQQQYRMRYGERELIPVSASDVAFSVHAVTLTVVTALQLLIFPKGGQTVSRTAIWITIGAWAVGLVGVLLAIDGELTWLSSATLFNYIQVVMTSIKYIPQAWMNYKRRSTVGWSIGNILLDLTGAVSGLAQMFLQSIDQKSFKNFAGNAGKLGLTGETIMFDLLFVVQHYYLYSDKQRAMDGEGGGTSPVPLLHDHRESEQSPAEGIASLSHRHYKGYSSTQDLEKGE